MPVYDRFDDTPTPKLLTMTAENIAVMLESVVAELRADIRTGNSHNGWREAMLTLQEAEHLMGGLCDEVEVHPAPCPHCSYIRKPGDFMSWCPDHNACCCPHCGLCPEAEKADRKEA